ncbi:MAG: competence/damage-inducible protein A [Calditrichia bacterium]|nr:competence/damage-inducible protein A [Calditrichia bacterium]
MIVEIISIGFELLNGRTVNTNASFMAKKLVEAGLTVKWITTIPDEEEYIVNSLELALKRADVVITTGGLGPTNDDITKEIITKYLGGKLIFNEQVFENVKQRFANLGLTMPEINRNQAMVPDNAEALFNKFGTAPGLLFRPKKKNEKILAVLPGVPKEMKYLLTTEIIPRLKENYINDEVYTYVFKTFGVGESALYEKLYDAIKKHPAVEVMFYPEYAGVEVKIRGQEKNEIEKLRKIIDDNIGEYVFSIEADGTLQKELGTLLKEKKMTISVAESCTGGLIGHLLTSVSGSSEYFMGGIISYSNRAKMELLNVAEKTLIKYGAVSEQTAKEMAKGVKEKLASNIAISVTGVAGPTGGTKEKPVGLVYIGLSYKNNTYAQKYLFGNDREVNKIRSASAALEMARRFLKDEVWSKSTVSI